MADRSSQRARIATEALTFDDVLLVPGHSLVHPKDTDVSSRVTRDITLKIPLLSAAMDTVTESGMAIQMAREGGIGIIHKNVPPERQAQEVDRVKRSESGMILNPITLMRDATLRDAHALMARFSISGVPIVESGGRLVGIITNRDLQFETDRLLKQNIRLRFMGDLDRLPEKTRSLLTWATNQLSGCTGMTLNLAVSYGARAEITEAARTIARKVREGIIDPEHVSEALITSSLATAGLPDLDLVIRTSGEQRLSNFMLWQCSYAELYFTKVLWPDFGEVDFKDALDAFKNRQRRFGLVSPNPGLGMEPTRELASPDLQGKAPC